MMPFAECTQVTMADPARHSGVERAAHLDKQAMEESGGFAFPARRKETA